ncbi:hypothetical protein M2105_005395 [Paenibacillus sp. PastF-1]|nr:hypothetical protein [Paenibacillus sp. PastF-2]MDF9850872.1 hypothetical protein [Paenibacillus sp. PastM-2]MDF9857514.1 hypothetical protein [Paenibacillus sp. PastF-1]MDH6482711.1 hypothetical protein [Paenibacillus sp. PastH-2]MDH6510137.1 hypothetical protein [Paenibacillus sp. PastM-3]
MREECLDGSARLGVLNCLAYDLRSSVLKKSGIRSFDSIFLCSEKENRLSWRIYIVTSLPWIFSFVT